MDCALFLLLETEYGRARSATSVQTGGPMLSRDIRGGPDGSCGDARRQINREAASLTMAAEECMTCETREDRHSWLSRRDPMFPVFFRFAQRRKLLVV